MLELDNSSVQAKIRNIDKQIDVLIKLLKQKDDLILKLSKEIEELKLDVGKQLCLDSKSSEVMNNEDFQSKMDFCLNTFEECLLHLKRE